ncbi:hypothetical protein [Variovorax sp. PCZ-1]|uniref:hypothetical protein n=1 Tax=Variovorax sp. PCZ-1 TaxID=2835533 RepID=UPI001BCFF595|nr:hypothetical protein [Variovorax sp. PCZ-1]MBS7806789.1 hypothetical protein [Variovorax sp. PCZ-1]
MCHDDFNATHHYSPPRFDAITAGGMLLLVAAMSWAWLAVLRTAHQRAAIWGALVLAMILLANLAGDWLGVFSRLDILPPPFAVLTALSIGLAFAFGMGYVGSAGDRLVRTVPVETLVALQIFRFPLELLMLRAAYLGIMPMEFSMLGYNLDVLTGLGALLISIYCAWTWSLPLRTIWLWNLLGIFCLLAIGILAALTSPNLHAFGSDAKHINSWVLYFPYSLLPTALVSFAVLGHVLLTRKLLTQPYRTSLMGLFAKPVHSSDPW